jgi:RNA-dependent RNA polymerase
MQQPSRCYDDDWPTPLRTRAPAPLPSSVAAALARLEAKVGQAADSQARARLSGLGEAATSRAL